MGSPCNTYGNEPPGFGTGDAGPVASQLSVPAGATCPRTPDFWYTIHGPEVYKTQGDQYMTRKCGVTESGCAGGAGSANTEFKAEGYFMLVRVLPAAVGSTLNLQLYDPAYVSTGSNCSNSATPNTVNLNTIINPWTSSTDAPNRYARNYDPVTISGSTVRFCTGDDPNSGNRFGSEVPTVTSFALRAPTDDLNPLSAPPVSGCTRQWPGYTGVTAQQLTRGTGASPTSGYNANLARVYHQWVPLCSFTPTKAGDYYLQVRTNLAMGNSGNPNDVCATTLTPGSCTGSFIPANAATSPVTQQSGDSSSILSNGSNRFAVRVKGAPAASVSVSAYGRMPMFANSDSASTIFNLIRSAAGGSVQVDHLQVLRHR